MAIFINKNHTKSHWITPGSPFYKQHFQPEMRAEGASISDISLLFFVLPWNLKEHWTESQGAGGSPYHTTACVWTNPCKSVDLGHFLH